MSTRTFRASSIQEAITKIKAEMGADAMILSTRRIPKGPRNPYGTEGFEVTAAPAGSDGKAPATPPAKPRFKPRVKTKPAVKETPRVEKTLPPSQKIRRTTEDVDLDAVIETASTRGQESGGVGWQMVQNELVSIRDMLFLMQQEDGIPGFVTRNPECLGLYTRLVKTGMSEKLARQLIERAAGTTATGGEEFTRRVFVEMLAMIESYDPFHLTEGQHVAAFIGPTGVGKTTTIAKLAADLSLKQKRRVGLISIDSYRIGALEQLKTYAAIMGVPCLPAFNREDLQTALRQMKGREVILIDTAGLSHLDNERMEELGEFFGGRKSIATHLVLSAATGLQNMRDAAESFSVLSPRSYVFTKMDETRRRGGIMDQIAEFPLPVSYVTDGQRVPEDIRSAGRKGLLKLIFEDRGI